MISLVQASTATPENKFSTTELVASMMHKFSPELINPAEEIVKVAADFWHPKAVMASTAASKPKAATAKSAELKPASDKPKP